MGSGCSTSSMASQFEELTAMARHRKIEESIEQDQVKSQIMKEIKLLLLGAGECGKSTIVKQMKIIHDYGYTEEEKMLFKNLVYSNTIQGLFTILSNMDKLGIAYGEKDTEINARTFCRDAEEWIDKGLLQLDTAQQMQRIWLDSGVQQCFERASEYGLNDSASYFLEALDRISLPDYIPSEQDVLRTRVRTTGIVEILFHYKGLNFRMLDVGGQRSERKKWIHCFDEAKAVIFIAALSDYDLTLSEDPNMNRMLESLRLFSTICNNRWFTGASMILFLNKCDLFELKLKRKYSSITICFPHYSGDPYNYEEATTFIQEEFMKQNKNTEKEVYVHLTCATKTNNITFVFDAVTDTLIRENLKFCGLY